MAQPGLLGLLDLAAGNFAPGYWVEETPEGHFFPWWLRRPEDGGLGDTPWLEEGAGNSHRPDKEGGFLSLGEGKKASYWISAWKTVGISMRVQRSQREWLHVCKHHMLVNTHVHS